MSKSIGRGGKQEGERERAKKQGCVYFIFDFLTEKCANCWGVPGQSAVGGGGGAVDLSQRVRHCIVSDLVSPLLMLSVSKRGGSNCQTDIEL